MTDLTCENCTYFQPPWKQGDPTEDFPEGEPSFQLLRPVSGEEGRCGIRGVCHRFPPSGSGWGVTSSRDWCGEFCKAEDEETAQ